jgi:putative RNA 2'-phosphotransferase
MTTDVQISKALSYWLRHRPDVASLELSRDGWADVDAVLAALGRTNLHVDRDRLLRVVDFNDKGRFEFSTDSDRIRARQGHSIAVDLDWPRGDPPARLYHGTVERFLPPIMAEGLKPMRRRHVHLSADRETARRVGQRRGTPIILEIDSAAMAEAGMAFFLSGNQVWLTDHVPPAFITARDAAF